MKITMITYACNHCRHKVNPADPTLTVVEDWYGESYHLCAACRRNRIGIEPDRAVDGRIWRYRITLPYEGYVLVPRTKGRQRRRAGENGRDEKSARKREGGD